MHKDPEHEAERGYIQVFIKVYFLVDIDWLKATEEDRKRLYVATRAVADAGNISVEEIIDAALGRKAFMGTDYISTFRRGKIRRSYAKLIHAWITENQLKIAHEIALELFPLPHTDAWELYLEEQAVRGKLTLVSLPKGNPLIRRVGVNDNTDHHIKLGQDFCFELDSDLDGTVIAFQGYQGGWYPVPLGQDGVDLSMAVHKGTQLLPRTPENQPVKLSEQEDLGLHKFVFVLNPVEMTGKFPSAINDNTRVHLVKVNFTVKG